MHETAQIHHSYSQLILLVEDNADVVAYTASCLQDYRLAVGQNGQEGFEIATNMVPDLIVTEQLCKTVFLSHSQLHRKLEALTGYSPNRFIRMVRLTKVKEILLQPDTSIGIIAIECGYSDAGYFSRVFKQETGVTPNEWRTQVADGSVTNLI